MRTMLSSVLGGPVRTGSQRLDDRDACSTYGKKKARPCNWKIGCVMSVLALTCMGASQANDWGEEYARRVRATQAVAPLADEMFGDKVNLFNGTVSFSATDISIHGNSALPVALSRTYDVRNAMITGPLGAWELDVPHLVSVHPQSRPWAPANRCSTVAAPPESGTFPNQFTARDFWDGIRLGGVSGGGDVLSITANPKLVKPNMPVEFKWMTKSGWFFSCLPGLQSGQGGQGFVGYSPDGVKYTFDWMVVRNHPGITRLNASGVGEIRLARGSVRIYATRVEDRFGNWVKYEWEAGNLRKIHSNDNREILLSYNVDHTLKTATADARTWHYEHSVQHGLTGVVNPDQSRWTYFRQGGMNVRYKLNPLYPNHESNKYMEEWPLTCSKVNVIDPHTTTFSVTHPSGAAATYSFTPVRHGRTNVPHLCMEGTDDNWKNDFNAYAIFHEVMSLQQKRVVGAGVTPALTHYNYASLEGGYNAAGPDSPTPPPHHKVVTVTHPNQSQTVHAFGKDYGLNEGQLLWEEVRHAGTTLQTTVNVYMDEAQAASQVFAHNLGSSFVLFGDPFNSSAVRPLLSTTVTRDGTSFSRSSTSFDAHARPLVHSRGSSLGFSRTESTGYHDNAALWVLGQVAQVRCVAPTSAPPSGCGTTGLVMSETSYHPSTALPLVSKKFDKLVQSVD